jgi:hypothetical protein
MKRALGCAILIALFVVPTSSVRGDEPLTAQQVQEGSVSARPGDLIRDAGGIGAVVPPPGIEIMVHGDGVRGAQVFGIRTRRDGRVSVLAVGDEQVTAPSDAAGTQGAAGAPSACVDDDYNDLDQFLPGTLGWSFKRSSTPSEITANQAETAIREGGKNIAQVNTNCSGYGDDVYGGLSYLGNTTASPQINSSGDCTGLDEQSVVAFGDLPANLYGVTCTVATVEVGYNTL